MELHTIMFGLFVVQTVGLSGIIAQMGT